MKTRILALILIVWSCFVIQLNSGDDQPIMNNQPYRSSFHFQSPKNWMNDPNGPMYYKGIYHLFYQHNPHAAVFGDIMIWGHSISHNLVNWVHIDPALSPDKPFDVKSCWSGSVTILPGNKPAILYTGIDENNRQVQNLAVPRNLSDPFLRDWVKYSQNPIINLPDGIEQDCFRDPSTAWRGADGIWRVIVGSVMQNNGMVFLYRSDNFFHWSKYEHPLHSSENTKIFECPDFYPVQINSKNGLDTSVNGPNVKHVFKASFWANAHDYYLLGSYDSKTEKYISESDFTDTSLNLRLDYGKFYASKSFFDEVKNRRILWGWVNESDSTEDAYKKGWSGLQAIPRQVWLHENGKQLVQWPIEEVETLRHDEVIINGKKLDGGSILEISGITAAQADIKVEFSLPTVEGVEEMNPRWKDPQIICSSQNALVNGRIGPFGLLVMATKDLTEQTSIFFRIYKSNNRRIILMCSDQSRSSLREDIDKTTYGTFLDIDPHSDRISLRSLIDHSIVESFGGGGKSCITNRIYPKVAINKDAHLYADRGAKRMLPAEIVSNLQTQVKERDGAASVEWGDHVTLQAAADSVCFDI